MKVLVVEDDIRVARALTAVLRRRGHEVHRVGTVAQALAAPPVSLILLDLNLPDGDGLDVCRRTRRHDRGVAIIAMTARGDDRDKVIGLRCGADDYVVKPFSLAELTARIDAVMRRAQTHPEPVLCLGPLWIDLDRREVKVAGQCVCLSRKEFDLLAHLARASGRVVDRDRLIIDVWGTAWPGAGRTLDVHMATLRAKLGRPSVIETMRGVGYRLHAHRLGASPTMSASLATT
jgi:DNA-binding response OmpR family regulator